MKTEDQINAEIGFQEGEYDRIDRIINEEPEMTEVKKDEYRRIQGRHAARRQALKWVLGEDT
jgi:hypothetical protein